MRGTSDPEAAQSIRVIIAEDQALLRSSLAALLGSTPGIEVVGEACDGVRAVEAVRRMIPDVVLMDVRMPRLDGIAALSAIVSDPACARTKTVILTMFELDEYVFEAMRLGAAGFLLKDTTPAGIVQAVRAVHAGQSLLSPTVTRALVERFVPRVARGPGPDVLTPRQTEVLGLVGKGLSNREIEERLHISHSTMKSHIGALLERLGARDRVQLVILAYEYGLAGR